MVYLVKIIVVFVHFLESYYALQTQVTKILTLFFKFYNNTKKKTPKYESLSILEKKKTPSTTADSGEKVYFFSKRPLNPSKNIRTTSNSTKTKTVGIGGTLQTFIGVYLP